MLNDILGNKERPMPNYLKVDQNYALKPGSSHQVLNLAYVTSGKKLAGSL